MPKALKIVAALMVALASAAIGWFGVKWYQDSRPIAAPSNTASPSPTASDIEYVRLTFSVDAVTQEVEGLLPRPECGAEWSGESTAANGVTLQLTAGLETTGDGDHITISSSFVPAGADPVAFLGAEGDYIVTRDGVVVSPDWGAEYVPQYYVVSQGTETAAGDGVTLTGPTLCDVADELAEIWANVDFATASDEDIAAAQAASDAFNEAHASLAPGEYKIYAVAPVMLGEPAAIARALSGEGITNIGTLSYSIGDSPLGDDERIADYCEDERDAAGNVVARNCNVPSEVLEEVLARDVPAAYVVDGAPALAVSEPITIVVE